MAKDEAKKVMKSNEFMKFFDESSRLVERALDQEFDLRGNFFQVEDNYDEDEDKAQRGEKVKY